MADFAENLLALRKSRKLTQIQLADYLDVQPKLVGRWERGQGRPHFDHILKLADVLEVSLDTLLRGEQIVLPGSFDIHNKRLQELCKKVDQLNPEDQEVICHLMDALIRKERIKGILADPINS